MEISGCEFSPNTVFVDVSLSREGRTAAGMPWRASTFPSNSRQASSSSCDGSAVSRYAGRGPRKMLAQKPRSSNENRLKSRSFLKITQFLPKINDRPKFHPQWSPTCIGKAEEEEGKKGVGASCLSESEGARTAIRDEDAAQRSELLALELRPPLASVSAI